MTKFVSSHAYSTPKKIAFENFAELTEKRFKMNQLCGVKGGNLCVIIFTDTSEEAQVKAQLSKFEPVIASFESDPIQFAFMNKNVEAYNFENVFGSHEAVLYKPKRNKFMSLPVDSAEALKTAVSDALGGSGSWSKAEALKFGAKS